jgi:hypothetical protein
MNLKKFFCRHKMERVLGSGWKFINTKREKSGYDVMGLPIWCNYNHFTETFKCSKCGKEEIRETSYIAKNHQASVLY